MGLVGDDACDLADACADNDVSKVRQAVADTIGRIDQHRIAPADEHQRRRPFCVRSQFERRAPRGIRLAHVSQPVKRGGGGEQLGVGGGKEALVGVDGHQLAPVQRQHDEAKARAFQSRLFKRCERAVAQRGAGGQEQRSQCGQGESHACDPNYPFPNGKTVRATWT